MNPAVGVRGECVAKQPPALPIDVIIWHERANELIKYSHFRWRALAAA